MSTPKPHALEHFLKTFDRSDDGLGEHLTCTEANAIAALFNENGMTEAAQGWLNAHYEDCDLDDHPTYIEAMERLPEGYEREPETVTPAADSE
ncbi:Hypothetical protein AJAP_28000 [Amycolatopsis japonica]|uniref:Uncharacterized protein n=1 Tax=Amycolatopsis japonica TaxID=208439 RepID=A0A075V1G8_9PSEU|nr:hypothetical protein [Amycolatopsis japonica]AIG78439.1 Hypothetical protein AJAP_28000 [Amycolatopsis japonica]